jgi:lambda repressor-like predicted transcriptional regulator/integrase
VLSATLPPWAAEVSAPGGKLVGCVEAGGIAVTIRKQRGHANLLLEVLMRNGNKRPARPVDSGTADVARATEHAVALAGELAAQAGMPAGEPIIQPPTYGHLLDEIARRGGADEKNLKAQLRSWMRVFGFDADDAVGDELGAVFDVYLGNFRSALRREGKAESTISPYLSRISKLRTIVSGLLSVSTTDRTFAQVLDAAIRAKGVTVAKVARTAGVSPAAIRHWRTGKCIPNADSQPKLPAVERLLGLPAGTLTGLLPTARPVSRGTGRFATQLRAALQNAGFSMSRAAREVGVSCMTLSGWCDSAVPVGHHREVSIPRLEVVLGLQPGHLSGLLPPVPGIALPYARDLTTQQQLEWDRLFRHKTCVEEPDPDRRPGTYWRVKSDGSCGSSNLFHAETTRYYGFLALPPDLADSRNSGCGRDHEQLSLIDFARWDQVHGFVEFRARRTAYNQQTRTFICFVMSLLRALTGYLWQGRGFDWRSFPKDKLEGPALESAAEITIERWRQHCELLHAKLEQWLKHLKSNGIIKRSRTYDHIAPILKAQHPVDYLVRLESEMKADLQARWSRLTCVLRAKSVRDLLLVSMMIRNPLREAHWEMMTWQENDPRSHLFKMRDGNYGLRYSREDFKAFAGSRDEDYEARIDPELTPLIGEYLSVHRRHLIGADCSDYVFRPSHSVKGRQPHERFSIYSLFVTLTRRHLGEALTRGFGPHGVRHVIATELVKNEDEGIQLAADALHNTPKMIEMHYGHLRSIDRTNRARRIVGTALAEARMRLDVPDPDPG